MTNVEIIDRPDDLSFDVTFKEYGRMTYRA